MERYQFTAEEGDVVRLKNGDLAVITFSDILCGGKRERNYCDSFR